jgi:hypothetical protein
MSSDQQKVMDVVFLIDATGSMSSTIKAAHDKAAEMAIDLRVKNADVDFRFGSICYRDPIDVRGDVHQVSDLASDIDSLVTFLSTVAATGGGDGPEDWVGAYRLALDAITWRAGAKTIVHIADAPAHGQEFCGSRNHEEEAPKLRPVIESVAKRGILLAGIDLNNGATTSFHRCKAIYEAAGGPKFTIEPLVLTGSYIHERAAVPMCAAVSRCAAVPMSMSLNAGKCYAAPPPTMAPSAPPPAFAACARPPVLASHLSASAEIGIALAEQTRGICADALEMAYG